MIQIRDLYKSFRKEKVLQGVNLDVKAGETMVIIGRSGCGKSVLLKHIIGLMRPDEGKVTVDGEDVGALGTAGLKELRKRFGMLFQGAALFDSLTVGENVALALREHRRMNNGKVDEIVARKLKMVGLEGIESKKPAELSGGQRKRVGLARALALNPEAMLYDEPTTGLDPIMSDVINELILQTQHAKKTTGVVVTHDMKTVTKVADRVIMLYPLSRLRPDESQILFDGSPEDLEHCPDPRVGQFVRGEAGERLREMAVIRDNRASGGGRG